MKSEKIKIKKYSQELKIIHTENNTSNFIIIIFVQYHRQSNQVTNIPRLLNV